MDYILNRIRNKIADDYVKHKEYDKAVNMLLEPAQEGYTTAIGNLGVSYEKAKDYQKAFFWYELGSFYDDVKSKLNLALMYTNGRGLSKPDYQKAEEILKEAIAIEYNKKAYQLLIEILEDENRYEELHDLLLQAIKHHEDLDYYYNQLGILYSNGKGVTKDLGKANECYLLAAKNGSSDGNYNIGVNYIKGNGIRKNFSKGLLFLSKAAVDRDLEAVNRLGYEMCTGQYIERDLETGRYLLKLGYEEGHVNCLYTLIQTYLFYDVGEVDYEKAASYLQLYVNMVKGNKDDIAELHEMISAGDEKEGRAALLDKLETVVEEWNLKNQSA